MSDFDPYREWLGIQCRSKPTYYQLLGVKPLESDAGTIRQAAKQQIARLRTVDVGTHKELRNQIRRRIERAVVCLTDQDAKADYDRQLRRVAERYQANAAPRGQRVSASSTIGRRKPTGAAGRPPSRAGNEQVGNDRAPPGTTRPQAAPASRDGAAPDTLPRARPWVADPIHPDATSEPHQLPQLGRQPVGGSARTRGLVRRLKNQQRRALVYGLCALVGFTAACVAFGIWLLETGRWNDNRARASDVVDAAASTERPAARHRGEVPRWTDNVDAIADSSASPRDPIAPATEARRKDQASGFADGDVARQPASTPPTGVDSYSAHEREELAGHLRAARAALADRNQELARRHLTAAEPHARRPSDRAKLRRLSLLTDYVEQYWNASRDGLNELAAGDEFQIDGERVIVVEKDQRRLVLRMRGKNVPFPTDDLPLKLAMTLADRWLDASAASTKVIQGAVMAVEPTLDADEARKLWRDVQASGQLNLGDLPMVLDDRYDLAAED